MSRRSRVSRSRSRRIFGHTSSRTRAINLRAIPMRGGFRL